MYAGKSLKRAREQAQANADLGGREPSMLEQLEGLCRDVAKLDDNGPDRHVADVKYEAIRLIMKFFTPEGD